MVAKIEGCKILVCFNSTGCYEEKVFNFYYAVNLSNTCEQKKGWLRGWVKQGRVKVQRRKTNKLLSANNKMEY